VTGGPVQTPLPDIIRGLEQRRDELWTETVELTRRAENAEHALMETEHQRDRAMEEVERLTCECVRLREALEKVCVQVVAGLMLSDEPLEAVLDGIHTFARAALEVGKQ
jgi:hypothetical protein